LRRYSFKNDFDIIFCQSGLAYYDQMIRLQLFEKFYQVLHTGGLLLAGHSEDLLIPEELFQRLGPTVYIK
jgi:chemotaxis protein methyltransferase CheR